MVNILITVHQFGWFAACKASKERKIEDIKKKNMKNFFNFPHLISTPSYSVRGFVEKPFLYMAWIRQNCHNLGPRLGLGNEGERSAIFGRFGRSNIWWKRVHHDL